MKRDTPDLELPPGFVAFLPDGPEDVLTCDGRMKWTLGVSRRSCIDEWSLDGVQIVFLKGRNGLWYAAPMHATDDEAFPKYPGFPSCEEAILHSQIVGAGPT